MKKRVIGLEICDRAIYFLLVVIEHGQVKILDWSIIELPSDLIVAGEIRDISTLLEIFNVQVPQRFLTGQVQIIVGISGLQAFIRNFTVPAVPKKEIDRIVQWEGENILPYSIADVIHSYQVMSDSVDGYQVLFTALHKERLEPYFQLFGELKLAIECVTIQPFGLVNYLEYADGRQEFSGVLARIHQLSIDFVLLLQGQVEVVRTILIPSAVSQVKELVELFITELLSTLEHMHSEKGTWLNSGFFFGSADLLQRIRTELPSFHWRHSTIDTHVHTSLSDSAFTVAEELPCALGLSLVGVRW